MKYAARVLEILGHIPAGTWGPISWVPHILARDMELYLNIKLLLISLSFWIQIQKNSSNIFYSHETSIFDLANITKFKSREIIFVLCNNLGFPFVNYLNMKNEMKSNIQ